MEDAEGLEERRQAEVEFVSSAYSPEEAWCETGKDGILRIHRRLHLPANNHFVSLVLTLALPKEYPGEKSLGISSSIEESKSGGAPSTLIKAAYNTAPKMVESCRQIAEEMKGDEAVFTVLSHADEWIQETWPAVCQTNAVSQESNNNDSSQTVSPKQSTSTLLGRRLIYSHHIISKIKRADMKNLAAHYQLTGYIKIGWPGLIIIEGPEQNCVNFYEDIKVWAWKYLVVRGEQQEKVVGNSEDIDKLRKFSSFLEESDMSVVASHCRQVGLESLFRTSMKQYDNTTSTYQDDTSEGTPYGTLVYIDHMNDGKNYRKWLRKTASETDVFLLVKQCFPNHDFSKRPTILAAIVGGQENVSDFMKRWRTSRVDVDAKGKACLERQMSVIVEGTMEGFRIDTIDWDRANAEDSLNVDKEQLVSLLASIGGSQWVEVTENNLSGWCQR